ncbi:MAG TPA: hypothetical protein PKZ84_19190 [Anaerolineae bacterium]|nr:hypothetical protein [Anaerolineae bacterium]HQI87009.1 hypothetical protein [Anaerolineae bacterium]
MTNKSLSRIGWLCFAALALLLASYLPTLAQTPTPPTTARRAGGDDPGAMGGEECIEGDVTARGMIRM